MADPILDRALAASGNGAALPPDPIMLRASAAADATAVRPRKKGSPGQDVVGGVLRFYGSRVGAAAAEAYDPLIAALSGQKDSSLPAPLARVALGQALITGKRAFGGEPTVQAELEKAGYQSPVPEPAANAFPAARVARALTGPAALGFAAELPFANALNEAGAMAFSPAAKAVANANVTRKALGPALEFFKRGASLPGGIRDKFYGILRSEEGAADWRAFLREKALGQYRGLAPDVQERIGNAVETKTVQALAPEEQAAANSLIKEYASIPKARRAVGGRAHELAQSSRLGYVPRIKAEPGVYGEPPVPPPAFGTNPGQARTEAGRMLTSREMGGGFVPPVEAAFQHGAAADTRIMHMGIVQKLAKEFGHEAAPGEATVASLRGIPTGFSPEMQAKLSTTALPKPLHTVLESLNERLAPDQWGRFSQFVRNMNQTFKTTALFSPGFVSRNVQNNIFQTAIFGNMDPETWKYAAKVLSGPQSAEDASFLEQAIRNGVIGRGQVSQEIGGKLARLPVVSHVRKANTIAEDLSRLSFFKYQLGKGLSPQAAAQKVDDVLINYSPRFASKGMAWARRNAFPFINWTVNAPQIFVRSAIERPGSLAMLGEARQRQIEAKGAPSDAALPDYLKQQMATPLGKGKYLTLGGYGSSDVNQLTGAAMENRPGNAGPLGGIGDELMNRAYPQYSVPVALYTGRDPFTGYELKTPKAWAKFLAGKVPATRIPQLAWDLAHNKKGAKERALSFLTGIRTVQRSNP